MGRTENVAIFEHTMDLCKSNPTIAEAIRASEKKQKVILETDHLDEVPPRFETPANILVTRNRTYEAAGQYLGQKTCVLNFASATNPGGGVAWGSTAQEECLCRCSTLYSNLTERRLWRTFYEPHRAQNNPLYNDDVIYTPDVLVFKSDIREPELLPNSEWWNVNVITCAAPNLRPGRDGRIRVRISNEDLYQLHVKRMRRIMNIAARNKNDVIILGAYGCGAFQNPPDVVAKALRQVALEYRYHFKTIEFAVYCSPRDDKNYWVFNQIIGGNHDRSE